MNIEQLKKYSLPITFAVLTVFLEIALIITLKRRNNVLSTAPNSFTGSGGAADVISIGIFLALNSLFISLTDPWRTALKSQHSRLASWLAVALIIGGVIVAAIIAGLNLLVWFNWLSNNVTL